MVPESLLENQYIVIYIMDSVVFKYLDIIFFVILSTSIQHRLHFYYNSGVTKLKKNFTLMRHRSELINLIYWVTFVCGPRLDRYKYRWRKLINVQFRIHATFCLCTCVERSLMAAQGFNSSASNCLLSSREKNIFAKIAISVLNE